MKKIILERRKYTKYTVNYEGKKYIWAGCKGAMTSKKEVSVDLYDYLAMYSNCIKNGELVLIAKTEEEKELLNNTPDLEEVEVNSLSKEDIIKLLNGKQVTMKKELLKITSETTKKFVLEVAKEIKLENSNKRLFIKEWIGTEVSTDDLFA